MEENSDVHVLPYLDPISKCKIEQAERIIECMNKKRFVIFDQIEQQKLDREIVISKLKYMKYKDRSLRYTANHQKDRLEPLQLALDRLKFINNAYSSHGDQFKSLEDEIPLQKLKFRLSHGSNSLAEERRLLKKTKKNQQSEANYSSMQELSYKIVQLNFRIQCYSNDEYQQQKIIKEIKELKWKREKAIANCSVNGRIWSSLGPKQTIQDNIKIIEEEVEKTRMDQLALRAKMKLLEKELEAIEKKIVSLHKQLTIANQRKGTAYQCILQLRK